MQSLTLANRVPTVRELIVASVHRSPQCAPARRGFWFWKSRSCLAIIIWVHKPPVTACSGQGTTLGEHLSREPGGTPCKSMPWARHPESRGKDGKAGTGSLQGVLATVAYPSFPQTAQNGPAMGRKPNPESVRSPSPASGGRMAGPKATLIPAWYIPRVRLASHHVLDQAWPLHVPLRGPHRHRRHSFLF